MNNTIVVSNYATGIELIDSAMSIEHSRFGLGVNSKPLGYFGNAISLVRASAFIHSNTIVQYSSHGVLIDRSGATLLSNFIGVGPMAKVPSLPKHTVPSAFPSFNLKM